MTIFKNISQLSYIADCLGNFTEPGKHALYDLEFMKRSSNKYNFLSLWHVGSTTLTNFGGERGVLSSPYGITLEIIDICNAILVINTVSQPPIMFTPLSDINKRILTLSIRIRLMNYLEFIYNIYLYLNVLWAHKIVEAFNCLIVIACDGDDLWQSITE